MTALHFALQAVRLPCRLAVLLAISLLPLQAGAQTSEAPEDAGASHRSLHFSRFVFLDLDRDGIYGVGDRPFSGLAVRLTRPDGSQVTAGSNLSGFANWNMLAGDEAAPINAPGPYTTEPLIPDGWIQTTAWVGETVKFRLLPQAPAGIVADATYSFVGIAPALTLSIPQDGETGRNINVGDGQRRLKGFSRANGDIVFDLAGTSEVTVTVETPGKPAVTRTIRTGNYPLRLSRHFFDAPEPAFSGRVTIGFDDVASPTQLREMPSGADGFKWFNLVATHDRAYGLRGHLNNTVSGDFLAYTSSGHPGGVSSEKPFDFIGGFFAVSHQQAEAGKAILEGWRGGEPVFTEMLQLGSMTPVHFLANWTGIDRLVIRHEYYWQVVIDDLQLRKP